MDLNRIVAMKSDNQEATAYYEGKEVFIRKIYNSSGLVEVIDLVNGDIYTLHNSKLDENNNTSINSLR